MSRFASAGLVSAEEGRRLSGINLLADAREHYHGEPVSHITVDEFGRVRGRITEPYNGEPLHRQEIVADAGFAQPDEPIYTISNDAPF
jgi:hypothetical protein